jgi:AcrR family transcriptional regulator
MQYNYSGGVAGLRERKKAQTRERIASVALELFSRRGFEAVTIEEICEAAEVARATLFSYFPTKEALALHGVGGDDLAGIVAQRPPEQSPLEALRSHYRAYTSVVASAADHDALIARVRVIFESPVLSKAADGLLFRQRLALADAFGPYYGRQAAPFLAAQVTASVNVLQEIYLHGLLEDEAERNTGDALAADVELAFDLLEYGFSHLRAGER